MSKWKEYYDYYKRNPINYYEDMLGVKFTKFQKIRLKIYIGITDYLNELLEEEKEILKEIITEPYGTTRYDVLKLHSVVLELKISIVKSVLKV